MKYLCLAYGDEAGWNSLSDAEKQEVLAQDEVVRPHCEVMTAVRPTITSISNWDRHLEVIEGSRVGARLPLAGFSVLEADDLEQAIALVQDTPCARARGLIEVYPFWDTSA